MPGLLQTSAITAFQSSLSSVLELFRLSVYFVRVFLCFWYHKSFHSVFAFLVHQLSLYAPKIVVVLFWWFWEGIFFIRPFPVLLHLTSFQSMVFSLFFWCTTFLLHQFFFLVLLTVSNIHIPAEGWTMRRLSECWFSCKFWFFCWWR